MTITKTENEYVDAFLTALIKRKFSLKGETMPLAEIINYSGSKLVNTRNGIFEMLVFVSFCKMNMGVSVSVMMNVPNQPNTRRECIRVCNISQLSTVLAFIDNF